MIKIDDDIPVPTGSSRRKYPFDELQVGQSFEVVGKVPNEISGSKNLAIKRTGFEFKAAKSDKGVRVWRTK